MIQKDKKALSPSSERSRNNIPQSIELFPTSIYILDERGIIIEVNSPALELTGGERRKIIQTSFINLIEENQRSYFQIFLDKSFKTTGTQKDEFRIIGKDNNYFYALAFAKHITKTHSGRLDT